MPRPNARVGRESYPGGSTELVHTGKSGDNTCALVMARVSLEPRAQSFWREVARA